MRIALISDIHANLVALNTVLEDIDRRIDASKGDQIWNLGDIIGYGPDPVPCADLVARRCKWSLLGNHDYGVLYEPTNFNAVAEQAAYWTREQFEAEGRLDQAAAVRRWEFLGKLRVRVSEGPFLCVHGTPRRPINEYLFPEDAVSSPGKMQSIFERIERSGAQYCLVGHTHVPGVFTSDGDFYKPAEMGEATWEFKEGERLIINPGSVGQPRDLDPRASYAIIEADEAPGADGQSSLKPRSVRFFRLEYDIHKVVDGIARVAAQIQVRKFGSQAGVALVDEIGRRVEVKAREKEAAGKAGQRDSEESLGRDIELLNLWIAESKAVSAKLAADAVRGNQSTFDVEVMMNAIERYSWLGKRLLEGR